MTDETVTIDATPEAAPAAEGGDPNTAPSTDGSAIANAGETPKSFSESIPEKFQVFTGEGESKALDSEASSMKLLESYNQLEGKFRGGEAPPESAEGYKIDGENLGEGFNAEEFMKDEGTQGFLKSMHAQGLNNKQVQAVLEYGLNEWAPNLVQGAAELTQDACVTSLKEVWQTDAEYTQNMQAANRAYKSLPQDMQAKVNERIGNDPLFNQIMATFGKEMAEDTPPSSIEVTTPADQSEIDSLMASEAYSNPQHPEHAVVSQKVKAWHEKRYPGKR